MGLDSVELLISFEDYFNIQVSDQEAEKINTVQEMVDCVARHLSITDNGDALKKAYFETLRGRMVQMGLSTDDLKSTDNIATLLESYNEATFALLEERIDLLIPRPSPPSDSVFSKVFRKIIWQPRYDWQVLSIEQFMTAVYANNYLRVLDSTKINNKYQILIAIVGIMADKLGVDFYEVQPEKSFTKDLGVD